MVLSVIAATASLAAGCSGGSSAPTATTGAPHGRITPDLQALLALPKATPIHCPPNTNGTTVGRASPWAGTVDVSVFMSPKATTHEILALGNDLRTDPLVDRTYFESQHDAYAEFQRLYTCSAAVSVSQTPPSYRLILIPTATVTTRDLLVARLIKKPDVDSVSCNPAVPCVNVVNSGSPTPAASPTSTS